MPSRFRTFSPLLVVALAAGCADGQMMQSSSHGDLSAASTGVPYYLPIGSVPVSLSGAFIKAADGSGTAYQVTVKTGAVQYSADTVQQYFLSYSQNSYSDDHATIHVDQNGLLQSASGQSTDQSAASAAKIVQLLGEIAMMPYAGPLSATTSSGLRLQTLTAPTAPKCALPPFSADAILTPRLDTGRFTTVDRSENPNIAWTAAGGTKIRLTLKGSEQQKVDVTVEAVPDGTALYDAGKGSSAPTAPGIWFRSLRGYTITTTVRPWGDNVAVCQVPSYRGVQHLMLPNDAPIFAEDMSRTGLVKKQVSLTIQNGMLTGVEIDKPSQFYAGVSLPADTLKALLAIPASVLTFRVQQLQAQQGLSDAEAKALQSQIDLIQKQNAYQKAAASGPGQTNP